ncbi:hypothetical protein PVA45_08095 (plasmid) [Entomospira entomophila]|uniref:Uncharacterized protein n=1 Tax=Entomospira entomophila TaxID=2719988 RepID=A0A968GB74_9SPIO|nr:hypothetical protein [Entomospira entomophilus]NIZ41466.1 hypothetical protein [Entomospira entomophilus]WDI36300.1 hypothetical protein PVA45_08095 [Entomospira entomophilus]
MQIVGILLAKILMTAIIVMLLGYLVIWAGYQIKRVYERSKQKHRANRIWQHYQEQQQDHLTALLQEDPAQDSITTIRQWPEGERVFFMMHHFLWWRISALTADATGSDPFHRSHWREEQSITTRMQEDRNTVEKTVERILMQTHLFVTNRQILLVADEQTEIGFIYKHMTDIDLYVDTLVITFITKDKLVIHDHYQPDMIAKLYQVVQYHYQQEHAG